MVANWGRLLIRFIVTGSAKIGCIEHIGWREGGQTPFGHRANRVLCDDDVAIALEAIDWVIFW
jgi:hypothetical protein